MAKTDVTIRRAPRIWSFMMTGAIVGIIVAAIITVASPVDPAVGVLPTFGFFAIKFGHYAPLPCFSSLSDTS